jgi:hypothetical protein
MWTLPPLTTYSPVSMDDRALSILMCIFSCNCCKDDTLSFGSLLQISSMEYVLVPENVGRRAVPSLIRLCHTTLF